MKPRFLALALALPSAQAAVYAHYSFDTNYTDSSGNARNGTLVEGLGNPTTNATPNGDAPAGTSGDSFITAAAGTYKFGGGALSLSADNDYVTVPQATFAVDASWTIAFWAKIAPSIVGQAATAGTFDLVIGDRDDTNNFIALGSTTTSRFRGANNSTGQVDFNPTSPANGNDWHHYAITATGGTVGFNTATIKIYRDGSLFSTATGKNSAFLYDTIGQAYNLNTFSNDFDFDGQIDEVWILNEAADATTVNNLFTINAIPEPSALLLLGAGAITLLGRRSRGKR